MNALLMFRDMNFRHGTRKICRGLLLILSCFLLAGCPPDISDESLKVEKVTVDSVTLSWKAASDKMDRFRFGKTGHPMLYRLYRSTDSNLNAVAEIEANGTPWNEYEANLTSVEIAGLERGVKYYFNVIVKCAADGSKKTYRMNSATPGSQFSLPPDPGDAGKVTLAGIDSDNDGVRDDVQIAIYEKYPDDEQKRAALAQGAKAMQEAVLAGDSSNTDTILQAGNSIMSAVDCLHERVENPSSELSFLGYQMINTSDRSEAYIKFSAGLNGRFFGEIANPCQE